MMKQRKILALLIVVVLGAIAFYSWQSSSVSQKVLSEANFPKEVAGAKLEGLLTGEEAMRHIDQLHGTQIAVENGYMAVYGNPAEQIKIVVWISQSKNSEEGQKLFKVMDDKMTGNKIFTDYAPGEFSGTKYVYVSGAGMDNYYYVQGKEVYWIGITGGNPEEIFKKVLLEFKSFQ